IYIHLESFQNFLIDYKLNGQEVTPFLNSFTKDANTLYFDNFFHQTGQGKTSDAEFMLENSMFGLPQGSVFTTKSHNTYQSAPAILGQQ
ncbi:glycerol phosphate lipoteichoic acid synthase, partial [Bacillus cereus]